MKIQDAEYAKKITQGLFKKNPRRSISAAYRYLRKNPKLTFIGDVIILFVLVHTVRDMGIPISRKRVLYALNILEEMKTALKNEKNHLLEQLIKPIHDGTKRVQNPSQAAPSPKDVRDVIDSKINQIWTKRMHLNTTLKT